MTILLASGSPRRKELLQKLAVPYVSIPSGVDEREPLPNERPEEYSLALARDKADAVHHSVGDIILAADTVVAIEGQILNKPQDTVDALRMLDLLRGKTHTVVTAVVVDSLSGRCEGFETTKVCMRTYSRQEIELYVATGEPMDKAGGYAAQGAGRELIEAIEGCYENVVGLPLCIVEQLFRACGVGPMGDGGLRCTHM
ncbi:MAG: Maf family nucleotide pyrophosphatase [Chloroflexota bacterium]